MIKVNAVQMLWRLLYNIMYVIDISVEDHLDCISVCNCSYPVERQWVRPPAGNQCVVCAHGPANVITEDLLKMYLGLKEIEIVNIVIPQGEQGTANIELANSIGVIYMCVCCVCVCVCG